MQPSSALTRRDWLKVSALGAAALAVGGRALGQPPAAPAGPLVRLTLNENPFGPSPLAARAIQENLGGLHRYVGDEAAALVQQIAAYEQVAPEQIVTGEILEALGTQLSLQAGPGGEFIYTVPGYPALVDAAARVGGKVVSVPLSAKLENDLPALARAITSKTRALFLVNPHNPSGTVSPTAEFAAFVREASKKALVIIDEAYLEFSNDYAGRTGVTFTRAGENVLVFRTFAKAWGLAGLPLGYAIAPRPVADFLRQSGLGAPRDLNRLAVAAASASFRDTGYIERVRRAVATERDLWHAFLDRKKLTRTPSEANFVYFDAGRPHAEVVRALQAGGIAIGRAFPPYDRWVRITIGLPEENAKVRAVLDKLL